MNDLVTFYEFTNRSDYLQDYVRIGGETSEIFRGSTCSDYEVFGATKAGRGKAIEIDLELPPHDTLHIGMFVWFIDSWNNETATIYLDDKKIYSKTHDYTDGKLDHCGRGYRDDFDDFHTTLDHTKTSVKLTIGANLNTHPIEESLGISSLVIKGTPTCHPACKECSGPGSDQCIECAYGYKTFNNWCLPVDYTLHYSATIAQDFARWNAKWRASQLLTAKKCPGYFTGLFVNGDNPSFTAKFDGFKNNVCVFQMGIWYLDSWGMADTRVVISDLTYDLVLPKMYPETTCGNQTAKRIAYLSDPIPIENPTFNLSIKTWTGHQADHGEVGITDVKVFCAECHSSCTSCTIPGNQDACYGCHGGYLVHVTSSDHEEGKCLRMTDEDDPCANGYSYVEENNRCVAAQGQSFPI
eukprot:CAMPEP_0115011992 /NCGR_PEP_ID=MMETSP0216-20121206/24421_1 /TAXON_ID=223996 /ORGANISM="Protocruzia adherens, Strain Boccale" /LENGTH=410 /DNA_ID=CAMNT_0002380863 /DNA_START=88 /DNA_END=1320 /DNA_ORIENTATION=-